MSGSDPARVAAVLAANAVRALTRGTSTISYALGPGATDDKVAAVKKALHGYADDIAASAQ